MRGDRLLLALEALHFFWRTMDGFAHVSLDDAKEHDPQENPRGFSYYRSKRVFSRARYRGIQDPIDIGEAQFLTTLRPLLRTVLPRRALSTITVDVLTMLTWPYHPSLSVDDILDKDERAAALREITSLLRFLTDVAQGKLTRKDF